MNQIKYGDLSLLKVLSLFLCSTLILGLCVSCDNNSNAQDNEIAFTEVYSGSFETGPASTDTNGDGRPANLGTFVGTSTFGTVSIQSLNEFELVLENANCDIGEDEFSLVRGNFVKRFSNGELIFGTWDSGFSCFDPITNTSTSTQVGTFTGGSGQFENASGPVQIDYSSTFLATPGVEGFSFGGTTGDGFGTIIFN
ncbi:MAG: hypothetical protein DHS20C13_20250 [Thermodesulfobacteriota bacterium]|nr:MAG: hypothetical protein DHS20C13_20250 [Thermodesulfobacteriota bacterium]